MVVWDCSIIFSYVLSFCGLCVIIFWMGLSGKFGLEFGLFVIARCRKLRGTNDNEWFCGRGGNCGAVGVVSILLCSSS